MPATNFPEYALNITDILDSVIATGEATLAMLQVDQRSAMRGFITDSLQFDDGSTLHFREFVDMTHAEPRIMYAYHYQDEDHNLIFRYDNAVHRPALPQSKHKHTRSAIEVSPIPTLSIVLDQILGQTS